MHASGGRTSRRLRNISWNDSNEDHSCQVLRQAAASSVAAMQAEVEWHADHDQRQRNDSKMNKKNHSQPEDTDDNWMYWSSSFADSTILKPVDENSSSSSDFDSDCDSGESSIVDQTRLLPPPPTLVQLREAASELVTGANRVGLARNRHHKGHRVLWEYGGTQFKDLLPAAFIRSDNHIPSTTQSHISLRPRQVRFDSNCEKASWGVARSHFNLQGSCDLNQQRSIEQFCGSCAACRNRQLQRYRLAASGDSLRVLLHHSYLPAEELSSIELRGDCHGMVNHVSCSVQDDRGVQLEQLDFVRSQEKVDHRDFESTWCLYKNAHKFESYIRRYVLYSETPVDQNPWTTFGVGFFLGVFAMMLMVIFLAIGFLKPGLWLWVPALRMFRGSVLIVFFLFFMGINTYGWRSSGVNHVLIFEIDPRSHLSHHEIMQLAAFFSVVWGMCVIYTLTSTWMDTPPYAGPFLLFTFMTLYLLNPLRIFHYKSRRWVLKYLLRIFSAPFHSVAFADFWLADQLNSLVCVFLDLQFFVCFYATQIDWTSMEALASHNQSQIAHSNNYFVNENGGVCSSSLFGITPIVKCLPAWFRFAQSMRRYYDMKEKRYFPHVVNAGKYATTFLVVIFATIYSLYGHSSIFAMWVLASIFSTCYTYSWDILMDWGFFSKIKETGRRTILREDLVYRYKAYYYIAIIEDLFLRLSWSVDMWLGKNGPFHIEILRTVLALLEVFRRFVWNFFRLENEHLNNCGEFRAVRDIYIAPISRAASGEHRIDEAAALNQPLNRNPISL